MARARGLLMLLTAAKAFSAHAAASGAPAAASKVVLGSGVAPVVATRTGGRGGPYRRLGYGALAAFAGAGILLTLAPSIDGDLSEEEDEEDRDMDCPGLEGSTRRPPSAQEIRTLILMLKRANREMMKQIKVQKESKDQFLEYIEELLRKANIVHSAVSLFNDIPKTMSTSITLLEKYGDHVQYYVCPFSGFTETVYVINIKPRGSGGKTAIEILSTERTCFSGLEAMGAITLCQELVDTPDMVRCQMNFKHLFQTDIRCIPKKATLIKALEEADVKNKWDNIALFDIKTDIKRIPKKATLIKALEEADVKNKWENSSCGKKLILQKRMAWLTYFDRFKIMLAKIKRGGAIRQELPKLQNEVSAA